MPISLQAYGIRWSARIDHKTRDYDAHIDSDEYVERADARVGIGKSLYAIGASDLKASTVLKCTGAPCICAADAGQALKAPSVMCDASIITSHALLR